MPKGVHLFRLEPHSEHGHGLSDRDFDSLFTTDKPDAANWTWPQRIA